MGYMEETRKKIGHDLLMMVGCGVFPYKDGKVLLQRRGDDGLWGNVGGALEPGETLEEAASRELSEEAGLTAKSLRLLRVHAGPEGFATYPNGDKAFYCHVWFVCDEFEGEPRLDKEGESLELRWFEPYGIPENVSGKFRQYYEAAFLPWLERTENNGDNE